MRMLWRTLVCMLVMELLHGCCQRAAWTPPPPRNPPPPPTLETLQNPVSNVQPFSLFHPPVFIKGTKQVGRRGG